MVRRSQGVKRRALKRKRRAQQKRRRAQKSKGRSLVRQPANQNKSLLLRSKEGKNLKSTRREAGKR